MTVLKQLAEFIKNSENVRNLWLGDDLMKVYVRRGLHHLGAQAGVRRGKTRRCLDIGAVEVYNERQGTWTNFIWKAHEMHPWECTFVECVHNTHLAAWLMKNGFSPTDGYESFYLPKKIDESWNLFPPRTIY